MSFRTASLPRWTRPLSLGGLVVALGSAASLPCRAAGRCDLEVTGTDTPAWRDAVGSLDLSAAELSDCSAIRLELAEEGSRLTYLTNDGRRAERELHDPSELAPTVEALLVTGVAARAERGDGRENEHEHEHEHEHESKRGSGSVGLILTRPRATLSPAREREREEPRFLRDGSALTAAFSLQLGVRGGAGGLVSPVLHGQVTMDRSRFEIGVFGALEPEYGSFGSRASDTAAPAAINVNGDPVEPNEIRQIPPQYAGPASAGVVGVTVGRRFAFTHLDVVWSGRLAVAALRHFDGVSDGAETRVGSAVDFLFPRASTLRYRMGLGAEVVPNDLSRSDAAAVPWWALSARLGIEVGGT